MGFLLLYKIIPILAFCNHIIVIVEHMGKSSVAIMIPVFTNISFFKPKNWWIVSLCKKHLYGNIYCSKLLEFLHITCSIW